MTLSKFATGSHIPTSGVYQVVHSAHRLRSEVILIRGDIFPRCSKCSHAVEFVLIRAVQDGFQEGRVRVYELPIIEEDDVSEAAS